MSTIDINGADDPPTSSETLHALDTIEIRTLGNAFNANTATITR